MSFLALEQVRDLACHDAQSAQPMEDRTVKARLPGNSGIDVDRVTIAGQPVKRRLVISYVYGRRERPLRRLRWTRS